MQLSSIDNEAFFFVESERCASCNGDCFVHGDDYTQVTCFRSTRSKAHLLAVILGKPATSSPSPSFKLVHFLLFDHMSMDQVVTR